MNIIIKIDRDIVEKAAIEAAEQAASDIAERKVRQLLGAAIHDAVNASLPRMALDLTAAIDTVSKSDSFRLRLYQACEDAFIEQISMRAGHRLRALGRTDFRRVAELLGITPEPR